MNEWRISCYQNKTGNFQRRFSEKNIDAFNGAQGRIGAVAGRMVFQSGHSRLNAD